MQTQHYVVLCELYLLLLSHHIVFDGISNNKCGLIVYLLFPNTNLTLYGVGRLTWMFHVVLGY